MRWIRIAALALAFAAGLAAPADARALHWSHPIAVDRPCASDGCFTNPLLGIDCPSARLCVVGGSRGLFVSSDPAGGKSTWSLVASPSHDPRFTTVNQGSCPSPSFCAFPSGGGRQVLTSEDPGGGAKAWTVTPTRLTSGQHFASVSCASASLCVEIVSGSRRIAVATHPAGGSRAWHHRRLAHRADSVSCVPHLCVITAQTGEVLTSRDPARGHWRSRDLNADLGDDRPPVPFDPIDCATAHYCEAAEVYPVGAIYASRRPTGGTGAWARHVAVFGRKAFTSVSCTASLFCAVAANDGSVFTSTGPISGNRDLARSRTDHTKDQNVHMSCASARFCAIDRSDGKLFIGTA